MPSLRWRPARFTKSDMSSFSRQQLEAWLSTLTARGKVLDVGGSQKPIQGRVKDAGATFTILDLEEPHEPKRRPDLIFDLNDNILDASFHMEQAQTFDQAFCIEVAEYWYNPLMALRNIGRLLKDNGQLFLSVHFLYPHHNPENADYLRYTRAGIRRLLKEAGFEAEKILPKRFANPQLMKTIYDAEGMKGVGKNGDEIHCEQGWLIQAVKME